MDRIFAYIIHRTGVADDTALELITAAKAVDANASPIAIAIGSGADLDKVCTGLCSSYAEVWKVSQAALAYPNAELIRKVLMQVLPAGSMVLVPHEHFGIDLAPGLSIKMNAAFVSDVLAIEGSEGDQLKVVRQEFGGQVSAHMRCDLSTGAVITVRPGAFKPSESAVAKGEIVDKSADVGALTAGRRYLETMVAEAGEVDIAKHNVLVSIGRGIQDKENIHLAQELAEALGAAVCCSRPVVDAKWLENSRQVGSSGKTVKPKVYLALGISGSFQHLAGLKGNPLIIAVNKNPNAPIFQTADIGIVDDILEFIPALTNKVLEMRRVA
ncbi:MAG: electron transfer flavoprotein subunit alpha/FixB family protein [Terracidiphilus sp.]